MCAFGCRFNVFAPRHAVQRPLRGTTHPRAQTTGRRPHVLQQNNAASDGAACTGSRAATTPRASTPLHGGQRRRRIHGAPSSGPLEHEGDDGLSRGDTPYAGRARIPATSFAPAPSIDLSAQSHFTRRGRRMVPLATTSRLRPPSLRPVRTPSTSACPSQVDTRTPPRSTPCSRTCVQSGPASSHVKHRGGQGAALGRDAPGESRVRMGYVTPPAIPITPTTRRLRRNVTRFFKPAAASSARQVPSSCRRHGDACVHACSCCRTVNASPSRLRQSSTVRRVYSSDWRSVPGSRAATTAA